MSSHSNSTLFRTAVDYSGTTETTRYIGGMMEIMTRGTSATEYRHLIPAGNGAAIDIRRSNSTNSTYYATSDHLGSADLVLDSSAAVLARETHLWAVTSAI
jgi:hypothetical protein